MSESESIRESVSRLRNFPVHYFALDVAEVLAEVDRLTAEKEELVKEVREMLAAAKQTNNARAGKSDYDEGREVAYGYVLNLVDGGRS